MLQSIRRRFKRLLLDAPEPQNREVFAALVTVMFPDRDDFSHFLITERQDEQAAIARRILLRLGFEAPLPATNRLVLNLLAFEASLAGEKPRTKFVGRDHFVHLVHLYLLGLYLFWYHSNFHKLLLQHFSTQIASDNFLRVLGAARLFLVAWTEFVLIHDLGYPMEIGLETPGHFQYQKPIGKPYKNIEKELALQCLSRLIALSSLCTAPLIAQRFEDVYASTFRSGLLTRSVRQGDLFHSQHIDFSRWIQASRMPSGLGLSLFSVLSCVVPTTELLAVVEPTGYREPLWIYEYGTNTELRILQTAQLSKQDVDLSKVVEQVKTPWLGGDTSPRFDVVFYVRDFNQALQALCRKCTDSETGFEDIQNLASNYAGSDPLPFTLASPYNDFNDCAFHFYHALLRDLDYVADDDENLGALKDLVQHIGLAKRAVSNLESRLVRELADHISGLIKRQSARLTRSNKRLRDSPIQDYVSALLAPLSVPGDVGRDFSKRMSDALRRQVTRDAQLHKVFDRIRKRIAKELHLKVDPSLEAATEVVAFLRQYAGADTEGGVLHELFQMFEKSAGVVKQDVLTYRPDYVESESTYCDHGVVGAIVGGLYLTTLGLWKKAYPGNSSDVRLVYSPELLFPTGVLDSVHTDALYAVLVHNLYPEFLRGSGHLFRTSPSEKPFAYFALFCDSIQPWDRKRLANPAYVERSYNTTSDAFDIDVRGNTLYISEAGHGLSIEDRLDALRRYLDTYLKSASSLIKLRLSEFSA